MNVWNELQILLQQNNVIVLRMESEFKTKCEAAETIQDALAGQTFTSPEKAFLKVMSGEKLWRNRRQKAKMMEMLATLYNTYQAFFHTYEIEILDEQLKTDGLSPIVVEKALQRMAKDGVRYEFQELLTYYSVLAREEKAKLSDIKRSKFLEGKGKALAPANKINFNTEDEF